ncbi:hypothetical protein HPB50_024715 [Hyalomma asiaticum]|uniref:Uncharacterized protein n=1 Tax=Hyalomma asiaticum TaxID=266040 RepID=A0ACB7SZR1_HYAAI|nr:hypothetical protein HPB50_024715 [Hyalomma asiaticum]
MRQPGSSWRHQGPAEEVLPSSSALVMAGRCDAGSCGLRLPSSARQSTGFPQGGAVPVPADAALWCAWCITSSETLSIISTFLSQITNVVRCSQITLTPVNLRYSEPALLSTALKMAHKGPITKSSGSFSCAEDRVFGMTAWTQGRRTAIVGSAHGRAQRRRHFRMRPPLPRICPSQRDRRSRKDEALLQQSSAVQIIGDCTGTDKTGGDCIGVAPLACPRHDEVPTVRRGCMGTGAHESVQAHEGAPALRRQNSSSKVTWHRGMERTYTVAVDGGLLLLARVRRPWHEEFTTTSPRVFGAVTSVALATPFVLLPA